jgi:hypothetical protein
MVCVGLKMKGLGIDNYFGKKPRVAGSTAPLLLSLSFVPLILITVSQLPVGKKAGTDRDRSRFDRFATSDRTERAHSLHLETKVRVPGCGWLDSNRSCIVSKSPLTPYHKHFRACIVPVGLAS